MIKVTYTCDCCYKEIQRNKTYKATINIKYPEENRYFMNKELELCPKCADKLAIMIMDFIQPPRKDV